MNLQLATQLINQEIAKQPYGSHPNELYEPIRYLMALGGKRMRPLLVLLGNYLFSDDWQQHLQPAIAVETFHNFTLMHDDIMDNAPIRRNHATVHEKWNNNIAILSGDVMLVKAYEILIENLPNEFLKVILQKFNACAAQVCEGQQLDMNFESLEIVSEEAYLEMIRLKTAVLLGFSLEMGAILANTTQKNQQLLYDFGVQIGVGFQLKDDLLDVYGNPEKFGKQVGGDIISNKKTFLLIEALQNAKGGHAQNLQKWLSATVFDKTEKVKAVTAIYDALKIKEITQNKIDACFQKAFQDLAEIEASPEKKAFLTEFTQQLIQREN